MAFREGEGIGDPSASDTLSMDSFVARGMGTGSRLATGTFDKMDGSQLSLMAQMMKMLSSRGGGLNQISSLTGLEQRALQFSGEQGQAVFGEGGTAQQGRDALSGALANVGADFENFYQTNIRDVLLDDFQENIRPGTSRKFADSGFFSSERERADELDMENLMSTLTKGRAETKLAANAQVGELTGAMGNYENQLSGLINQLFAQGGRPRDIAGQEFDRIMASMMAALGLEPIENVAVGLQGETGGMVQNGNQFMGGLGGSLCWVAEEVFGTYSDKTLRIRDYMAEHMLDISPLGTFARAYMKYGQYWASLASDSEDFRRWATKVWNLLNTISIRR